MSLIHYKIPDSIYLNVIGCFFFLLQRIINLKEFDKKKTQFFTLTLYNLKSATIFIN